MVLKRGERCPRAIFRIATIGLCACGALASHGALAGRAYPQRLRKAIECARLLVGDPACHNNRFRVSERVDVGDVTGLGVGYARHDEHLALLLFVRREVADNGRVGDGAVVAD